MRALRNLVVGLVVLVVLVDVLTGQVTGLVLSVLAVIAVLNTNLRTVLIAVALPTLLVGGLVCISPWHRDMGVRIMTGALLVLGAALLGPPFLHWFEGQLAAYGARLFGSGS